MNAWVLKEGARANLNVPEYHLTQPVMQPIPHVTIARYVQLAGLAPGEYSLAISVKDTITGRTETAHAPFTVAQTHVAAR